MPVLGLRDVSRLCRQRPHCASVHTLRFLTAASRARAQAILTSATTLRENPRLRFRFAAPHKPQSLLARWRAARGLDNKLVVCVLTSKGLDLNHPALHDPDINVIILTTNNSVAQEVIKYRRKHPHFAVSCGRSLDPAHALRWMQRKYQHITVEAGPTITNALCRGPLPSPIMLDNFWLAGLCSTELPEAASLHRGINAEELTDFFQQIHSTCCCPVSHHHHNDDDDDDDDDDHSDRSDPPRPCKNGACCGVDDDHAEETQDEVQDEQGALALLADHGSVDDDDADDDGDSLQHAQEVWDRRWDRRARHTAHHQQQQASSGPSQHKQQQLQQASSGPSHHQQQQLQPPGREKASLSVSSATDSAIGHSLERDLASPSPLDAHAHANPDGKTHHLLQQQQQGARGFECVASSGSSHGGGGSDDDDAWQVQGTWVFGAFVPVV